MDTGDILMSKEMTIPQDMNAEELFDALSALGTEALMDTMKALENGTLRRTPQDHSKAVNVPMITKEMGQIDWSKSAADVHNLVRGTYPWPGAYTFYKGGRLKIWKTALAEPELLSGEERYPNAQPGTIVKIHRDFLLVAAGKDLVKVLEVQFENARRMGVHECGHNMDEGEVLG
jgi:methionyl-tRNA formyltransferase